MTLDVPRRSIVTKTLVYPKNILTFIILMYNLMFHSFRLIFCIKQTMVKGNSKFNNEDINKRTFVEYLRRGAFFI